MSFTESISKIQFQIIELMTIRFVLECQMSTWIVYCYRVEINKMKTESENVKLNQIHFQSSAQ